MEVFANTKGPIGTLTKALNASETTLKISAGAPAALQPGTFKILIDNEFIQVSVAPGASLTWTIERGKEGTAAEAHALSASVFHKLTAGVVQKFLQGEVAVLVQGTPTAGQVALATGPAAAKWSNVPTPPGVLTETVADEKYLRVAAPYESLPSHPALESIVYSPDGKKLEWKNAAEFAYENATEELSFGGSVTLPQTIHKGKIYDLKKGVLLTLDASDTNFARGLVVIQNNSGEIFKIKGKIEGAEEQTITFPAREETYIYHVRAIGEWWPLFYSRPYGAMEKGFVVKGVTRKGFAEADAFEASAAATGSTTLFKGAFVGVVAGKAPTDGTWKVGDWVVDRNTAVTWVCTVAGTPGTWISSAQNFLTVNGPAAAGGYLGQTFDQPTGSAAPVTGTIHLVKIMTPVKAKFTKIVMMIPNGGAGVGLTSAKAAIYTSNSSGSIAATRRGETAEEKLEFEKNEFTVKMGVPSFEFGGPNEFLWVALLLVGGTMPKLLSAQTIAPVITTKMLNANLSNGTVRAALAATGATVLPAEFPSPSVEFNKNTDSPLFWAAVA